MHPLWASVGWHSPPRLPKGKATKAEPVKWFCADLGPDIITVAADDGPSGISTYSVAGAAFGYLPAERPHPACCWAGSLALNLPRNRTAEALTP